VCGKPLIDATLLKTAEHGKIRQFAYQNACLADLLMSLTAQKGVGFEMPLRQWPPLN
jgi:hypothetical protein